MATFAETLKQLREKAGLTQAALAHRTGLSLGVVRDYEQGRKEPAMRSAFKLAEALGVTCEAFAATEAAPALQDDTDAQAGPPAASPPKTRQRRMSEIGKGKGKKGSKG
jgi:transcriptional regulator with XRE-family HTH domain